MQPAIPLSNSKLREIQSSILLCIYMLLCFYFHFVSKEIKPVITILIMLSSVLSLFYSRMDKLKLHYNFNIAFFWITIIILCFVIQAINSNIHPASFYLISAPAFGYFILECKFNRRIIYIPILVISVFFVYYIVSGQDLNKIFPHTSRNYISVIMITNAALINIIEWKQFRKISLWPSLLTLLFSVVAIGRAGIICSSFFFLGTLYCLYHRHKITNRFIYSLIIIIPAIILIILFFDSIMNALKEIDFFDRLFKAGIKDAPRKVLLQTYLSKINFKTLMLGYNYESNPLFVKLALNPHNSFIRLHYYVGILFFPVVFYLFKKPL